MLGPRGRPAAVDWAGPEIPCDAPRIESPSWELCGTDAYVYGPLVYPKKKPGARDRPGLSLRGARSRPLRCRSPVLFS